MDNEILTTAINNQTAYKLGLVGLSLIQYPREKIGDEIDRGLVLRRLLEEAGFGVVRLTQRALDGANACRVIEHVYIDGACAECGSPEPPRR